MMLLSSDFDRMAKTLEEIANDKFAGEFIRDKAKRGLSGKRETPPRSQQSYE